MATKKYLITGLLGLLLTGIIAFFTIAGLNKKEGESVVSNIVTTTKNFVKSVPVVNKIISVNDGESLLRYIPDDFDQVMMYKKDQGIDNLLSTIDKNMLSGDFLTFIEGVNEIAIYQNITDEAIYEFVLFNKSKDVDIKQFEESGLIMVFDDYEIIELGGEDYFYGKKDAYNYIKSSTNKIKTVESLKTYTNDYIEEKTNVLYIFNTNDLNQYSATIASDIPSTDFGIMGGKFNGFSFNGFADLLFTNNFSLGENYNYSSKFLKYLNEDSILYLELGNLMQLIGDNTQLVTMLEFILKDYDFLTSTQIEDLVTLIDGNIGLYLGKADNIFGIGGGLYFDNNDSFDTLYSLFPMYKETITENIGESLTGVNFIENENEIGIEFDIPLPGLQEGAKIELIDLGDDILLSFLNYNPTANGNINLNYSDKTLLSYYISMENIYGLYQSVLPFIGYQSELEPFYELFKDKNLFGELQLSASKASFTINLE